MRSSDGNIEKSKVRPMNMTIIRMSRPDMMLMARRKSSRNVGSGMMSITTTDTTPIPIRMSDFCIHWVFSKSEANPPRARSAIVPPHNAI